MTDILRTTVGDMPLEAVEIEVDGRSWSVLHTGAVISHEQEMAFLLDEAAMPRPYGVMLWPSAIALAHDLAQRDLRGKTVLELGAGTGLPGIIAAARGARVVQTDRQSLVLHVCEMNAARNGVSTTIRKADWLAWDERERYDLIIGADVLYAPAAHAALRSIFDANLAAGGTLLIADPFRAHSLTLLEGMEAAGWSIAMDKWTIDLTPPPRQIGVFALTRSP